MGRETKEGYKKHRNKWQNRIEKNRKLTKNKGEEKRKKQTIDGNKGRSKWKTKELNKDGS
jgi:hypothetical protein